MLKYVRQVPADIGRRCRAVFFGWWIVAGSMAIQFLLSGLLMQAYSTYAAIWREEFGWSKTALAAAFALQRAESGLLGPIQGWLLERFGPRNVLRVGILLLGFGFIALSQVNTLLAFFLTFIVMSLGAGLAGILTLMTVLVNWFDRRRATALSLMQTGMSIGGLAIPLIAWCLITFGWRPTALASGIVILVVGLLVAQLIRTRPEDYGLLPDGVPNEPATHTNGASKGVTITPVVNGQPEFTARQALRTRAFWFLSIGHALAVLVVSAVLVHLVVHLNEGLGYTIQQAAGIFALMTACSILGQLLGGYLGDTYSKRIIVTLAMFGHASALLALAYASSLLWVLYFAAVHGLAWGIRGPLMGAMRADYFGRHSFATIMGFSSVIVMFGSMGGPLIAGIFADYFGTYRLGFTILAVLAASGSIFFFFAKKPEPESSNT